MNKNANYKNLNTYIKDVEDEGYRFRKFIYAKSCKIINQKRQIDKDGFYYFSRNEDLKLKINQEIILKDENNKLIPCIVNEICYSNNTWLGIAGEIFFTILGRGKRKQFNKYNYKFINFIKLLNNSTPDIDKNNISKENKNSLN